MKILLIGPNGQVGWELHRSLLPLGQVTALDRTRADLSKPEQLRQVVRRVNPELIVNAAAYTAVDRAEDEQAMARLVNSEAPGVLAEEARRCGALLIHYSTDYVFDGARSGPYVEDDATNPLNVYGSSKLAGEEALRSSGADYLILRTSWVYSARGNNFLLTMLRLMRERESLSVIADQCGAPTWARLIAEVSAQIALQAAMERRGDNFHSGTYHLTSAGTTSWHGFAVKIADLARASDECGGGGLRVRDILPIAAADYGGPTRRPANSQLSTAALTARFSLLMPAWDEVLGLCMAEINAPA